MPDAVGGNPSELGSVFMLQYQLYFADTETFAGDVNDHSVHLAGVRSDDPTWVNIRVSVSASASASVRV